MVIITLKIIGTLNYIILQIKYLEHFAPVPFGNIFAYYVNAPIAPFSKNYLPQKHIAILQAVLPVE